MAVEELYQVRWDRRVAILSKGKEKLFLLLPFFHHFVIFFFLLKQIFVSLRSA